MPNTGNRTAVTQLNIRVDDALGAWLDNRQARYMSGSKQMQARTDLALLRDLLTAEARRVPFTVDEARALASIVAGAMIQPTIGHVLWPEVADAFSIARAADPTGGEVSSYAAQFGIDENSLLERLQMLSPAGDLAVRDALSRWWRQQELLNHARGVDESNGRESGEPPDDAETFAAAGLRITRGTPVPPSRAAEYRPADDDPGVAG